MMKYNTSIAKRLYLTEAITEQETQKIANELGGKWIRMNEERFAHVLDDEVTVIEIRADTVGCACEAFKESAAPRLCKHILAFKALPNPPQLTIESPECDWLREYLFEQGWYGENGYVYPSLDEGVEEPTKKVEPVVVKELPPPSQDPEPVEEKKEISRKCQWCGHVESGHDATKVKDAIAKHREGCPKNPVNLKKKQAPKGGATEKAEPPSKKKSCCRICGTEYDTVDDALACIERCQEKAEQEETSKLVQSTQTGDAWTNEQIEVIRKTVAERATPEELAYFLNVARYAGLNPFLREIYFVKTEKGNTSIITSRDGYLTIAKRAPQFKGLHSMEVCENDLFEMALADGRMTISKHEIVNVADRGRILGAWATAHMEGLDYSLVFVKMSEYDRSKEGPGGNVWRKYPSSMIRKVAEAMVLKRIAGISGLVTDAEMGVEIPHIEEVQ